MSEKKKMENQLDFLYEETKREGGNIEDIENIVVSPDVFGKVQGLTDHDTRLKEINYESREVVENMASFYLEKYKIVYENKHLKDRILFDSKNLGDMNFIQEITKKAVVEQMKYIEMGEASPRLYETLYVGIKELKDNVKQSTQLMSSIESAYKDINRELEKFYIFRFSSSSSC